MLKKCLYVFAIVVIISPLCSCFERSIEKNKGIIDRGIYIKCNLLQKEQENFIINDDSTFKYTFTGFDYSNSKCAFPAIDFKKYTLLGLFTSRGRYGIKCIRRVTALDKEKKYRYEVTNKHRGWSRKSLTVASLSYNWVLVPKLPTSWTVDFEKEYIK